MIIGMGSEEMMHGGFRVSPDSTALQLLMCEYWTLSSSLLFHQFQQYMNTATCIPVPAHDFQEHMNIAVGHS